MALKALSELKVYHEDIRPINIMITKEGEIRIPARQLMYRN